MCLSATDSSREPEVHLGVDTMKVLERGHGVATLNILVKDELRNTTLMHELTPLAPCPSCKPSSGMRGHREPCAPVPLGLSTWTYESYK